MGRDDSSDDSEAEAVPVLMVSAARVEALERLEEPVNFPGGMIGPLLVTLSTAAPSMVSVEM